MREAERRDLQKHCETMLHGAGGLPGLGDLVRSLESKGQVPERITGVLIRFGRVREMLNLLAEEGGNAREMRQALIVISNRLGALMRKEEGEVRLAIEDEAIGTSRRLGRLLSKEPSRTPVRKTWFPLGGNAEFENFLRELDSAEYLRSALSYIDFRARLDPWADFSREHSAQVKFLVHEAERRGFQNPPFHPKSFWWRRPTRWEMQEEGPVAVHRVFRGRASSDVLVVLALVGSIFVITGFAVVRMRILSSSLICTATLILAGLMVLLVLYFYFKEVVVGTRKIEYWVGKRKRFEAEWKDVESVKIWRTVTGQSAYRRTVWGYGDDDDTFDLDGDGRVSGLDLGAALFDIVWDVSRSYEHEAADGSVTYGMVIRTSKGELELKSGWGFTASTIQGIFEAIKRVRSSHPHIKLVDMRGWKRKW